MENIKITEEELKELHQFRYDTQNITNILGEIEIEFYNLNNMKNETLDKLNNLKKIKDDLFKKFNEKYGVGTIDIETGTFTKNKI